MIPTRPWPSRNVCACSLTNMDCPGIAWEITQAVTAIPITPCPRGAGKMASLLLEDVLPRHLSIIYDINARF
jgi:hypothetical protein